MVLLYHDGENKLHFYDLMMTTLSWWPRWVDDHAELMTMLSWWPRSVDDHTELMTTFSWWPRCVDDHIQLMTTLSWILIVQTDLNNRLWVDISLHLNTLFWFRGNWFLLLLLNAAYSFLEKQQIPIDSLWFNLIGVQTSQSVTQDEQTNIRPPM